jgi:hypothetical protein
MVDPRFLLKRNQTFALTTRCNRTIYPPMVVNHISLVTIKRVLSVIYRLRKVQVYDFCLHENAGFMFLISEDYLTLKTDTKGKLYAILSDKGLELLLLD